MNQNNSSETMMTEGLQSSRTCSQNKPHSLLSQFLILHHIFFWVFIFLLQNHLLYVHMQETPDFRGFSFPLLFATSTLMPLQIFYLFKMPGTSYSAFCCSASLHDICECAGSCLMNFVQCMHAFFPVNPLCMLTQFESGVEMADSATDNTNYIIER